MTSDSIPKADQSGKSCAQPICHHLRSEHLDGGASGKDRHCTLCKCSAYVSGPQGTGVQRSIWNVSYDNGDSYRLVQDNKTGTAYPSALIPTKSTLGPDPPSNGRR